MKKIFIAVLILISTSHAFAQADNFRADLDYLFGALDKTKCYTGYLAPYGIDAVDKDDFNGILSDSNLVNSLDLLRFIYADLLTAKFNPSAITLPEIEDVNQSIQAANPNSLVLFYANYNEFNENAINQGLLYYTGGRLYDNNVEANNIIKPSAYINKKIFASNFITQSYTNTVTVRYNPTLFYNNTNATLQNVWINFGNGYSLMPINTDVSNTYTDSTGYHRIAIKAQMSNGDVVETYAAVMVQVNNTANNYASVNLTSPSFVIPASLTQSGCKVYIIRSANTPSNQLLKPFIIAEGLDLHDGAPAIAKENYNVNKLLDEWNKTNFNGATINFNFDNIGSYDLVFIDWNNGVDDIRRNALT